MIYLLPLTFPSFPYHNLDLGIYNLFEMWLTTLNHQWFLLFIIPLLVLCSCNNEPEDPPIPEGMVENPEDAISSSTEEVINALQNNYDLMPEEQITINADSTVFAQYTMPVNRYSHNILGDAIEAGQLVVWTENTFYELTLKDNYVFEDIRPRLFDVDNDGVLEFITIRTHVDQGAGIVIYKIREDRLSEYAFLPEIGTRFRWLNIAAINNLDQDETIEIAWIQTPHIGGILKVAKIRNGELQVLTEVSGYSNHGIGERNLCLSVLTEDEENHLIHVPNQSRNKVTSFVFKDLSLQKQGEVEQSIDFAVPLKDQLDFPDRIEDEINCIR